MSMRGIEIGMMHGRLIFYNVVTLLPINTTVRAATRAELKAKNWRVGRCAESRSRTATMAVGVMIPKPKPVSKQVSLPSLHSAV